MKVLTAPRSFLFLRKLSATFPSTANLPNANVAMIVLSRQGTYDMTARLVSLRTGRARRTVGGHRQSARDGSLGATAMNKRLRRLRACCIGSIGVLPSITLYKDIQYDPRKSSIC